MGGPHTCKAMSLGFDHRLEIIPSPHALLLQVETDGREFVLGDSIVQQSAISMHTFNACGAKRRLCWMEIRGQS